MKNKGGIILLTAVISFLCIYYLSFTFVSKGVQNKATDYATNASGNVDFTKRQNYLDSVWNEPVYNFLGIEFTYKDIKETELNLGLDLQGGMHVTLEVSPIEIVKGLSGDSKDPAFVKSLAEARQVTLTSQASFVPEFYSAYQQNAPGQKLSYIFANAANRGRISLQSTDEEVLEIINTEVEGAIDRSFQILRTRIDRFGTSQPNIQRLPGTGRIQIELPGVDNPERVRKLLQGVAMLEFWEVNEVNDIFSTLSSINQLIVDERKAAEADRALSPVDTSAPADSSSSGDLADLLSDSTSDDGTDLASQLESDTSDLSSLSSDQSPLFSLMKGGYGLMYDVKDTSQINRLLERKDVQSIIPSSMKFLWSVKAVQLDEFSSEELLELYAVKTTRGGKAPLTGEVITDARQDLDQSARPAVSMQMNATGAKAWRKLTSENINRRIAIVLDNYVYSAPMVQGEIPNGSSSITGTFTLEEAKDLANVLKAGTLPAPTTIVEDVVIGATLGEEAQKQGIISIVAGLAMVVIFMVAYYSKGGIIANLALAFNVFFILGILAQLSASLTLPGIAGIVLTIGMAIDANVLIFERIREELRGGAGIKQAISSGYEKAYSSIIDSNATTFLTGLILYTLGQGPVKGFAITLMIGIVCSFFSAVFITRVIVEWWSKKGDESNLSFETPLSRNFLQGTQIDFLGKRKLAYIFSGAFIALGLIAFIIKGGLSMGVDFTGGRSYVVSFTQPQVPSEMKVKLSSAAFDGQSTEVKTYGGNNVLKITTSYLINNESDEADAQVRQSLIDGVAGITGLEYIADDSKVDDTHFSIASSSKVGATIADDIKASSTESVIFALITIFLYIVIRFRKWQFGLGALVALFHDVLFVLAAISLANLVGISFEVDQVFIAAMLTLIGYSINDTVVVFDRVRENMAIRPSSDNTMVFNLALNETISRTTITSATTLFVVLILFLFGGEVLKGFSFTLLVGILIGTYSSLFIATPVVLDFEKRKKK